MYATIATEVIDLIESGSLEDTGGRTVLVTRDTLPALWEVEELASCLTTGTLTPSTNDSSDGS